MGICGIEHYLLRFSISNAQISTHLIIRDKLTFYWGLNYSKATVQNNTRRQGGNKNTSIGGHRYL